MIPGKQVALEKEAEKKQPREVSVPKTKSGLPRLDMAVCATYLCNAIVLNLPVVLMPMITSELSGQSVSAYVTAVTSIATLGALFA